MKKYIILGITLFLINCNIFSSEQLRVLGDKNFPPYEFLNEDGQIDGFLVDLMFSLSNETGRMFDIQLKDWTQAQEEVLSGKADFLMGMKVSENRLRNFDFGDPYLKMDMVVFTRYGSAIRSIKDSTELIAAVEESTASHDWLVKNGYKNILKAPDYKTALEYLLNESADVLVVGDYNAAQYFINAQDAGKKLVLTDRLDSNYYAFAVKKGNKELLKELNQALSRIKKDGTFDKIYKKWFGEDLYNYSRMKDIYNGIFMAVFAVLLVMIVFLMILFIKLRRRTREIQTKNIELQTAYRHTEDLTLKLQTLIDISSKTIFKKGLSEQTFFDELLKASFKIVPEADYGSISLVDEDRWCFVSAVGHDIEKLRELDLKAEYMIDARDIKIVNHIFEENRKILPKELFEKINEASVRVKESMIVSMEIENRIAGNISLDIGENNPYVFTEESKKALRSFANIAASFMAYKNFLSMKNRVQEEVISAVLNILDMHDPYTKGHSKNVAILSRSIAAEMGYAENECEKIYWAGLVHDIGKILISVGILNKPAKLTVDEYDEIKKHPVYGYEFFNRNQGLKDIAEIVLYHHERYDGRGYPKGLREGEIPVFSRIIAVADAFDAMTNNRSYRRAVSTDEAVAELKKESAKQFDPHIVDIAVRIIRSEAGLNIFS